MLAEAICFETNIAPNAKYLYNLLNLWTKVFMVFFNMKPSNEFQWTLRPGFTFYMSFKCVEAYTYTHT